MRPFQNVLVGVDFTPCSGSALREAIRLAGAHSGSVQVVHIIDTQIALELEAALTQLQTDIRDGLICEARRTWREFVREVPEASSLPIDVSVGHRIQGLLKKTHQTAANLLVLGAFGSKRPDVGFGTVATACVRHASCDVLLVRDAHKGRYSKIVAAVDFSESSQQALERAAQIARQDQAQLHIVHVFSPPWDPHQYRAPSQQADPKFLELYRRLLSQRLDEFVLPFRKSAPDLALRCELSDAGTHRSGIVKYAEQIAADLICLGTRGRSNIRDAFLGSTAEKVLLHSKCSVLAVRPDANTAA
jgi:nucleotide-binding universal stress UspA family protein